MKILEKLNIANIDSEKLQRGLKHLGLNLSKFDNIEEEERVSDLIELFKIAIDVDPKVTTKFTKMDIRSKLEKVLKGQSINNRNNNNITQETPENNIEINDLIKRIHQNSNPNREPQLISINKKLGKVKFFDHKVNNFGILITLIDQVESHVSSINIVTPPINDGDIVRRCRGI